MSVLDKIRINFKLLTTKEFFIDDKRQLFLLTILPPWPLTNLICNWSAKKRQRMWGLGLRREIGPQLHVHLAAPKWPKTIGDVGEVAL